MQAPAKDIVPGTIMTIVDGEHTTVDTDEYQAWLDDIQTVAAEHGYETALAVVHATASAA